MQHSLSSLDEENRTAICAACGPVKIRSKGLRGGVRRWDCVVRKGTWERPYIASKGDACENPSCTATIVHPCQLDVHHVDGDHNNNDPANLATLCSNCHRLVTWELEALL